jgi:response regulator RpfG family c-di-GMP phosphodiesterase
MTTISTHPPLIEPIVAKGASLKQRILVVDDDLSIRLLLKARLQNAGFDVQEASDAREALGILTTTSFDLALLDVRMPGMSGLELLPQLVKNYGQTGVVMLTACDDVSLAVQAMQMGAVDYILKSFLSNDIVARVKRALEQHVQRMNQEQYVQQMEEILKEQTTELRHAFRSLQDASDIALEALVTALDAREHETQAHSKRVGEYTVHLARIMGVEPHLLNDIGRGAMLHDIGKIGVADSILLRPSKLTDENWTEMRKHPQIGCWILRGIDGLKSASEIVLAHHERYDGTGYPRGLKGESIPLGARIFSAVDCMDAMITDRPYRTATNYEAARDEIMRCSGSQFDPVVVKYFLQVLPEQWEEVRERTLQNNKNRNNPSFTIPVPSALSFPQ